MKDSNLSPQQQALRRSIALYSERSGVSAATISVIAEKFIGLLAGRWEHLCDVALADECDGKVNVGFTLRLDITHKVPVGTLCMSFSLRTKDETSFEVDDPNQGTLPFDQAVREQTDAPSSSPQTSAESLASGATSATTATPAVPTAPTPEPTRRRRRLTQPVAQ